MTCDGAAMTGGSCTGKGRGGGVRVHIKDRGLGHYPQLKTARRAGKAGSCYDRMAVQELRTAGVGNTYLLLPLGVH